MKKKLFGIILIVVIVALTYFYLKGKSTTDETTTDQDTVATDERLKLDSSEEMLKIRLAANEAYKDLKGWGALHPDPYKPIVKFTQAQFAKFVEFYKNLYPKGFQHHIDNQGLAWNRTSDLYQLKLALNRLLATV
jgi:hypothetical protein